jgi:hypothetical protein
MRRLILGVALLAIIGGAAVLGFAAGGHATSKPSRTIELHFGDHLTGNALKVGCNYGLSPGAVDPQERPRLLCFGPTRAEKDPELVVVWTSGAVEVNRCWNDCVREKHLFTARR